MSGIFKNLKYFCDKIRNSIIIIIYYLYDQDKYPKEM